MVIMTEIESNQPVEQPNTPVIRIDYGPYNIHGVIEHRIQRLYGLIRQLTDLGYQIQIRQIMLLDRVELIMFERKIFQCNITFLKFNMIAEYDPVCQRAVAAVQEAAQRMTPKIFKEADEDIIIDFNIDKKICLKCQICPA